MRYCKLQQKLLCVENAFYGGQQGHILYVQHTFIHVRHSDKCSIIYCRMKKNYFQACFYLIAFCLFPQSCIDGCDDMAKYLIEHKANVNACDKESWTPLHAAVACGHVSIIQYLMENGGNILALNLDGNFPVDLVDDNDEVEKYLEQLLAELGESNEVLKSFNLRIHIRF